MSCCNSHVSAAFLGVAAEDGDDDIVMIMVLLMMQKMSMMIVMVMMMLMILCPRRRGRVVRVELLPKSAFPRGWCRGVIRLDLLLKAANLARRSGGRPSSFLPKAA